MERLKAHGLQATVGLILGGLVATLVAVIKPNELGMILYIMVPTLLYAGAIGFGLFGFIGTLIGFLAGGIALDHEFLLWALRAIQFLVPMALLTTLFYAKGWRSDKRLNDEGIVLVATLIIGLFFIGFVVASKIMGKHLEATIEDIVVVGIQQIRGAYGENGRMDSDVEYLLTLADSMVPVIKNTIIGASVFLWVLWHEICFRIAKDVLRRSNRLPDSLSIRKPKVHLWHSGIVLIALATAILVGGSTRFIAYNVATMFILSYAYSGFRQMADWIGQRIYLRIGMLVLLYFLSIPMLIVLIIMGIGEQVKVSLQYLRNKRINEN